MEAAKREALIAVARGEEPADLVLQNASVVNVFTGEIYYTDAALYEGYIAGLGAYRGREILDLEGFHLTPGFIEGHIHLESTMLSPLEFVRGALPHGTTTMVIDPHEIANVSGLAGIHYILEASEGLPIDIYVQAPSCVPASEMETAGARLEAKEIRSLLGHPRVLGLAEVMNFPGVVSGSAPALEKLEEPPKALLETVRIKPIQVSDLRIPVQKGRCRGIGLIPGQLLTERLWVEPKVVDGEVTSDPGRDLLKLAVVERHRASGRVGLGLVNGLGLKEGALATSVAHDSHNIVAAGCSDPEMVLAISEVSRMQGGMVAVKGKEILARVPLPLAGLMSLEPLSKLAAQVEDLSKACKGLGTTLEHPFLALSFSWPFLSSLSLSFQT